MGEVDALGQTIFGHLTIEFEAPSSNNLSLLFPEEAALIQQATSAKRRELFAAGRIAARRAISALRPSKSPSAILRGPSNEPLFPSGIHASISHCDQLACAVASSNTALLGLGVDIEQRNRPLSPRVVQRITSATERECYRTLPDDEHSLWIKIFCAKEAIFKAAFPYILRDFSFPDVSVLFSSESYARVHFSERLESRLRERCPPRWKLDLDFREGRGKTIALAALYAGR